MKCVVITGGAGFVGSHLADYFLRSGSRVVCLDDFSSGRWENLESQRSGALEVQPVDVADECDVAGPVDAVLHFASPASPADYLRTPLAAMRAGSLGTLNALELARRKGARFLLASTSEVYGDPQVHPQEESYWGHVNPVGPRSVYDEAKRFGEALTMAYRRQHDADVAIVRIFNTFGPRMRHDDGRAVPTFISQALSGAPITVSGDGSQTRSFCYVDDLVEGVVRMLESKLVGPVNLGNPEEIRIDEIARRIIELTRSTSRIELVDRPTDDPERRRPDISKARGELGWEPRFTAEDGLRRTIDWFRHLAQAPAA
ncbi:UDP-glucuronic acid decarboxylase family protein [Streptomyces sp. PTY087I2]|uniref:UDP-glucuronic acid decarboxylase family protein n=1 Tax=Streptomyces sp. PTY087I2 TaxID=1819298 RepID=UPI00080B2015|nr:UDP-glucuronic acid decarboxylase family protein [Streptomyces sp. PTY087I2]OCC10567.1 UDP-glucose 4-epimerase [Streptomyces sp. PTY087I2]